MNFLLHSVNSCINSSVFKPICFSLKISLTNQDLCPLQTICLFEARYYFYSEIMCMYVHVGVEGNMKGGNNCEETLNRQYAKRIGI